MHALCSLFFYMAFSYVKENTCISITFFQVPEKAIGDGVEEELEAGVCHICP